MPSDITTFAGITNMVKLERKIAEVIGSPAFFVHQGPVIVHASDRATNLGTRAAHPSRVGISIFRALPSHPNDIVATLLKLYPSSHHISSTEFAGAEHATRSFNLRSNTILFVQGSLKMELSQPAGGYLVWQGFSARPWVSDPASSEAFDFMRI
jgi:hypothetical protein